MKKSQLGTLMPFMAAALLLVACSSSESSTSEPSATDPISTPSDDTGSSEQEYVPYFDSPVTIQLWTTAGNTSQTILENYIEDFKEIEPNVTVVNNKINGSYDDLKSQIITGFSSDAYPDLAYCYPDHVAEYLYYGKAVQLDDYMNDPVYGWTDEDYEDIVPAFVEEGQQYAVEGTYSVPFSKSTEGMFYNPVLIGLDISSVAPDIGTITQSYIESLTWEELFNNLAPALKEWNEAQPKENQIWDSSDEHSAIVGYDSDDNLFITLAQQYGYEYTSIDPATGKGSVDFDNEGMKSLMKMLNKAAQDDLFITKGACGDYVNTLFTEKKVLFSIGSTGGITYQYSEANTWVPMVAPIPQAENGATEAVMSQGPSMVVLSHPIGGGNSAIDTDRIMASWLFYRFMVEADNSTEWALESTGYMPLRYSCYETSDFSSAASIEGKEGLDLLLARGMNYYQTASDYMFTSPVFIGSSACRVQGGSIVTQVLQHNGVIDDATLDSIFDTAVNNALAEIK